MSRYRDEETAAHLSRMSHYSYYIALHLADKYKLSDERIEYILQFAPLHDIGKMAVPDRILLKRGPLSEKEQMIMRTHVEKGLEIVDMMIGEFNLEGIEHVSVLRNIIAHHHEFIDGSGYPYGLKGDAIPIEGRIAAAADVFDALTSARPYKTAWSFEKALEYMISNSGIKFDPDCVEALEANLTQMIEVSQRFKEESF